MCVCYHKKEVIYLHVFQKQTPLQLYSNTQTKNEYKYFTRTDEYVVHVVVDNDIPKICNNVIIQQGNHSSWGKYTLKGKIVKGTGLIEKPFRLQLNEYLNIFFLPREGKSLLASFHGYIFIDLWENKHIY